MALVRAYSCKKILLQQQCNGRNSFTAKLRRQTVSESPVHRRKNVKSGHSQTVIKLPDQERLQERLRVATVNVGTLHGRGSEFVETVSRRNINIRCLQEFRWRGAGMRTITGKDTQYKLFWIGNQEGNGVVGVMLAEKWIQKVCVYAF